MSREATEFQRKLEPDVPGQGNFQAAEHWLGIMTVVLH